MRNNCKECPWKNKNEHSLKFRTYAKKMKSSNGIENHICHMINKDVWGYNNDINDKNDCIGSKQSNKN